MEGNFDRARAIIHISRLEHLCVPMSLEGRAIECDFKSIAVLRQGASQASAFVHLAKRLYTLFQGPKAGEDRAKAHLSRRASLLASKSGQ